MKNGNEKTQKTPTKYHCIYCDFLTSNKKDYNRHILTRKHKKSAKGVKKQMIVEFMCIFCEKGYKYKSGLSRHKKKCKVNPENFCGKNGNVTQKLPSEANLKKGTTLSEKKEKQDDDISLKEILMQQLKQQNETIELLKQSIETNTKMMPKIGNNNNNTISINVFLNEQCKNAMNLTDFINQVQVSLEDLQYSKNNGFIEGVTNIFTKQLQDLDPTERPIHCSDKKRLQFYVKEDDVWQKDTNNEKIDRTITNIKIKQAQSLTEWEKDHPNFQNDPALLEKWQYMMANLSAVEGKEKASKNIARNIAEVISIKEAMPKK